MVMVKRLLSTHDVHKCQIYFHVPTFPTGNGRVTEQILNFLPSLVISTKCLSLKSTSSTIKSSSSTNTLCSKKNSDYQKNKFDLIIYENQLKNIVHY